MIENVVYSDLEVKPDLQNNAHETYMILAPHCDDEVLSCGGIIQEALNNGINIKVVFITNGDGFRLAAIRNFKQPYISGKKFRKFGELRQQEAIAATRELGLKEEDIFFLGYPDSGLDNLWKRNWTDDNPYISKFTKLNVNSYQNSYRKFQYYTGENLVKDLQDIILKYNPSKVFVSSAYDNHPDHRAVFNFLKYTLIKLKSEKMIKDYPSIYQYLIHWNRWPLSLKLNERIKRNKVKKLEPPVHLKRIASEWINYPLSIIQGRVKLASLREYKTQLKVMKRYLLSFINSNEIFLEDKWPKICPVNIKEIGKSVKMNNKTDHKVKFDLNQRSITFFEPSMESRRIRKFSSADIKKIELNLSTNMFSIKLELAKDISKNHCFNILAFIIKKVKGKIVRREIELNIPVDQTDKSEITLFDQNVPKNNGIKGEKVDLDYSTNSIQINLKKIDLLRDSHIFLNVESYLKSKMIDRSGWKVVKIC